MITVHVRTRSAANLREHWAARARRAKTERTAVALCWPVAWRGHKWRFPLTILLVRQAPRRLDDDNLRGALKAVRDEVAHQLGVDDGPQAPVRWSYGQEKGPYAVLVAIEEGPK